MSGRRAVIDLERVEPHVGAGEWFERFYADNADLIRRENKSSASRIQDVMILAWLDRMGGFVGSEEEYVKLLSQRVWQRERREYRTNVQRRRAEADVLMDRLIRESEQSHRSIDWIIETAPEEYRQILEWKYVGGYTNAEIARLIGKGESTIELYVTRAYRGIREQYS